MDADRKQRVKQILSHVRLHGRIHGMLQLCPHPMFIVECSYCGQRFQAAGHSECGKNDVWDATRGRQIAVGRAEKALARKIEAWERRHQAQEIKTELGDIWAKREAVEAAVA